MIKQGSKKINCQPIVTNKITVELGNGPLTPEQETTCRDTGKTKATEHPSKSPRVPKYKHGIAKYFIKFEDLPESSRGTKNQYQLAVNKLSVPAAAAALAEKTERGNTPEESPVHAASESKEEIRMRGGWERGEEKNGGMKDKGEVEGKKKELGSPKNNLPPPDSQEEDDSPPARSPNPFTRGSPEFPGEDARGHPDTPLLAAPGHMDCHEAEKENVKAVRTPKMPIYLHKKPEVGEDIELVLDVLVPRTEGVKKRVPPWSPPPEPTTTTATAGPGLPQQQINKPKIYNKVPNWGNF